MTKVIYSTICLVAFAVVALGLSLSSSDGIVTIINTPKTIAYASSIAVDFSGSPELWTVIGGDIALTSSGLAAGFGVTYRIDNGTATNCNVILPASWRKISGATTNILASGAIGLLAVKSYAANDTNVVCTWASE